MAAYTHFGLAISSTRIFFSLRTPLVAMARAAAEPTRPPPQTTKSKHRRPSGGEGEEEAVERPRRRWGSTPLEQDVGSLHGPNSIMLDKQEHLVCHEIYLLLLR